MAWTAAGEERKAKSLNVSYEKGAQTRSSSGRRASRCCCKFHHQKRDKWWIGSLNLNTNTSYNLPSENCKKMPRMLIQKFKLLLFAGDLLFSSNAFSPPFFFPYGSILSVIDSNISIIWSCHQNKWRSFVCCLLVYYSFPALPLTFCNHFLF